MNKAGKAKKSVADEDFSRSKPLPARLPAGLIGHGRPEAAEKVAVPSVIGQNGTLDAKKSEQLIGLVVRYGVSRTEAASLAPLVDEFIKAKLTTSDDTPDQLVGKSDQQVPTKAPRLYADYRTKGINTSESFLREVYGAWLGEGGGLYQNSLRKLDPLLMKALDNAFTGRREDLAKLLPTKSEETNERLRKRLGVVPEGRARQSALSAMAQGQQDFSRRFGR